LKKELLRGGRKGEGALVWVDKRKRRSKSKRKIQDKKDGRSHHGERRKPRFLLKEKNSPKGKANFELICQKRGGIFIAATREIKEEPLVRFKKTNFT